jgi:hypothetical protein
MYLCFLKMPNKKLLNLNYFMKITGVGVKSEMIGL